MIHPTRNQQVEDMTAPHLNALFQTAVRLTASRFTAEQATLEACTRALRCCNGNERPREIRLKLFKILIQQTRRRQPWLKGGWSGAADEPWRNCSDELQARASSVCSGEILEALARVPLPFREMVLLVDCQEFSYTEAAEILGVPADEFSDRLALARQRLRWELATRPTFSQLP